MKLLGAAAGDVTVALSDAMGSNAGERLDAQTMNFDPFQNADWRKKVSDRGPTGRVAVTLSTGKTVEVDSAFLGYLRLLAEELAADDDDPGAGRSVI